MRSSFVVLQIGTVPDGQGSFKPIIEGLAYEELMFFVVLSENWGTLWRSKNTNKKKKKKKHNMSFPCNKSLFAKKAWKYNNNNK